MAKKKVKQKRSFGQRIVSSMLIALAPIVIDFAVDKISQANRKHKEELANNPKKIKDVTNSLD